MEDGSILDSQITESSYAQQNPVHAGRGARLNNQKISGVTAGVWAAGSKSAGEYLQVDLGSVKMITKLATQGRPGYGQRVTEYTVSYSNDTDNWKNFEGDCVQVRNSTLHPLRRPV
jgi:hypothetical protein